MHLQCTLFLGVLSVKYTWMYFHKIYTWMYFHRNYTWIYFYKNYTWINISCLYTAILSNIYDFNQFYHDIKFTTYDLL